MSFTTSLRRFINGINFQVKVTLNLPSAERKILSMKYHISTVKRKMNNLTNHLDGIFPVYK